MILYFSGTGNSRFVAQKIGSVTGDQIISINDRLKQNNKESLHSDSPFVFVCPTYAWRIPRIVEDYIKEVAFSGSKKAYFILTCGNHTLNAVHYVKKLCRNKGFDLLGFDEILMPENYIALFTAPEKEECDAIIVKANTRITRIAMDIRDQHTLPAFNKTDGIKGQISSGIVNPIYYKLIVTADGFHVTEKCVHCGKCAKLCPINNIDMVNGIPVWGKKCTHCMACICGCPTEAIEYKGKTQGKTRYYLSDNHH